MSVQAAATRTGVQRDDKSLVATLRRAGRTVVKDFRRNKILYLMLLPVVAWYLLFHYGPMYGAQIAFRDFSPAQGHLGQRVGRA